MKILIVSAWYAPFIHPRAHRWTALAEQWASEGHKVQVLTARIREQQQSETRNGVFIHRVGFDSLKEWVYFWFGGKSLRGRVGAKPQQTGRLQNILGWLYEGIWKNLYFPDDACVWYFPARKAFRRLIKQETYDVVITVSLPFTGHLLGLYSLAKSKISSQKPFWIADIGDPFSFQARQPNYAFFYQKLNKRLERSVLESADALVVTTLAAKAKYQSVFDLELSQKMVVIPPVLSGPIPIEIEPLNAKPSSKLKLGYFGALYAPIRTPDALIELLSLIFEQRADLQERIELHFYGEIFPAFYGPLSEVQNLYLHGLCSRVEAAKAMQQMDVLLNIGNTTDFQLPSKVVDYLASGKPVLNLSYVEKDPFADFFQQAKAEQTTGEILNIQVGKGMPDKQVLLQLIAWLESEKPALNTNQKRTLETTFLVQNISKQYLQLIF